jgi:hypothetical protein
MACTRRSSLNLDIGRPANLLSADSIHAHALKIRVLPCVWVAGEDEGDGQDRLNRDPELSSWQRGMETDSARIRAVATIGEREERLAPWARRRPLAAR